MEIGPVWDEIDDVRTRAEQFLRQQGLPKDQVDAVTMVTCELTENAVKYGTFKKDTDRVSIDVSVSPTAVIVEVKNPVTKADAENLTRLDRTVQWIRGYQDPFEAYLQRFKEVSWQSLESRESGLGLVRIAYEGQSVLDFYVDARDLLAVSAIHRR